MVAPNGARKSKQDHGDIPLSINEIVDTANACAKAGADAIHAHVRDNQGKHCLDVGLYRELITELSHQVPQLKVQITTEAVGIYSPTQQRDMVYAVKPAAVSVSLKEMLSDGQERQAQTFYYWAFENKLKLQHILYSNQEVDWLDKLIDKKIIPAESTSCLYVLGRYTENQFSQPSDLNSFLLARDASKYLQNKQFMVCAFGAQETACLLAAANNGGDCRIGFENNLLNADGTIATDNAARVAELVDFISMTNT